MFHFALVAVAVVMGVLFPYLVAVEEWLPVFMIATLTCIFLWGAPAILVRRMPRLATWLFQGGYVVVFLIIAGSTTLTSWLAFAVPNWLSTIPEDRHEHVTGVIVGGLNALVGALWLDAAKDPESALWPQGRNRALLWKAFKDVDKLKGARDESMEFLYSAIYDDHVPRLKIRGWSFAARRARAKMIATLD